MRAAFTLFCLIYCFSTGGHAGPGSSVINSREHEGEIITCDLPLSEMIRNIGSKLDGAGMCVFSSIEMAARWQGLEEWR